MSRYRAIVIDGKRVLRRLAVLGTVTAVFAAGVLNIRLANIKINTDLPWDTDRIVDESLPVLGAGTADFTGSFDGIKQILRKTVSFALTFDPFDPRTVVFGHLPLIKEVSRGYLATQANQKVVQVFNPKNADLGKGEPEPQMPESGVYPIAEVNSAQEKGKNKIQIRNETRFSVNIDEMLREPLSFDINGDEPEILIVHTHATESYSPEGALTYSPDKGDRSDDPSQNVIAVGDAMESVFEKYGIKVIHDKTLHDKPSYNTSYANSLKTVEGYLAKYPSIKIVFDVHRDAYVYENGSKAKFVTEIDGKKTAQLMLVAGTNDGGLEHPHWRENVKLALKLQSAISKKYPGLMRGINLRKERFNGHTTKGSLIIEVGSSGNTLGEAIRGATYAAEEIAEFLNKE